MLRSDCAAKTRNRRCALEARRPLYLVVTAVCGCVFALVAASGGRADEPELDFNRDIRPILSDTCFKCHGFDARAREADLRLDVREEAIKPRDGDVAPIVPGHPEQSIAFLRLTSSDPDEKMPPPASHLVLAPAEVATFKRWIELGAEYKPHWAFIPPADTPLPKVKRAEWPRNPIDYFVLARLEREGLAPSAEADRRTLLRRVHIDFVGLPPTPAEYEAFINDPTPDAYEKVVDRLLGSSRYGERMVLEWLDAARYADSNGFQGDPIRTMWPWRDWVIQAMNDNMPFDQFTIEQLAGDLLPGATESQRLASGFNRNHPYNGEGGRIPEETRVENVIDRVDTTSTTFLGLTIGCAKCHDHKYDPVTQREYYQLFAYFNQCSESGENPRKKKGVGNAAPMMDYATPQQERELDALRQKVTAAESQLDAASAEIDAAQAEWEASSPQVTWSVVSPDTWSTRENGTYVLQTDGSLLATADNPATDILELRFKINRADVTGIKLEALPDDSLPAGGPGRSAEGNFVLTRIEADAVPKSAKKKPLRIAFDDASATYSQRGFDAGLAIATQKKRPGWAVYGAPDKNDISAVFRFSRPADFVKGTELQLRFVFDSEHEQHTLGRLRISITTDPIPTPAVTRALALNAGRRRDTDRRKIREFFRERVSLRYRELSDSLASARDEIEKYKSDQLYKVMIMDDAAPRPTHILVRGQYNVYADEVTADTPSVLPAQPEGAPPSRLGLAQWLVDPRNPLTSRVIVNRYWQQFFGIGLVKTPEDFGTQGDPPSHPELLDWLAHDFVTDNWNVKAIQRLIVTSSTYRQSSKTTPELRERDPNNRLLARGPRYRLSSFALRDQALFVSGLLVDQIGGPPVFPYQPPGIWEDMTQGQVSYKQDAGDKLYRRSVYTFWRRTVAPTTMFDVSGRSVCAVQPSLTNTPLQALVLLNDPAYIEAARVLAETLLHEELADDEARLDSLYMRLLGRRTAEAEQKILIEQLGKVRQRYAADPQKAQELLKVGEKPRDEKLDAINHAAWAALVNMVMNTDEVITKE